MEKEKEDEKNKETKLQDEIKVRSQNHLPALNFRIFYNFVDLHVSIFWYFHEKKLKEDLEKEKSVASELEKELAEEKRLRAAAGIAVVASATTTDNKSENPVRN